MSAQDGMEGHAEAYLGLGFALFTVAADCRSPIVVKGRYERGVHDATRDRDEVMRRLRERPGANLALACGEASGVTALDIDAKGDVDGFACLRRLEAEYGELPLTWTQRTPSGGEHRLFVHPRGVVLRNKVGLRLHREDGSCTKYLGLDIRTSGGSIALTPSRKPTGAYIWLVPPTETPLAVMPRWLLHIALSEPVLKPAPPVPIDTTERAARYVAAALDGECSEVASCRSPGRNQRLFQAAANLGTLVGANVLQQATAEGALERAAQECGLLGEDGIGAVRATIASGIRRGMANPRELRA